MTAGRRGVALTPMETRREVILRTAELADELGYEVFSLAEGWALDSTLLLAEVAERTKRIRLAAGVLSVWGRTAATIAMGAATMHRISGGRFVLGLGASTPQLAEGFHDVRYERPAERLRRVTLGVRTLLAGERARVEDTTGARPLRLGLPPTPDLPIWIAASGRHTIRLAAELADGWFPLWIERARCQALAAELAHARASAARRADPLTVATGPFAVVDEDVGAARAVAAGCAAWYLTAMGDLYAGVVSAQGFEAEVAAVTAANPRPDPRTAVVPEGAETLLGAFTAYGPAPRVIEELEGWDSAVDVAMVGLPPGLPWPAIEATLRAAAPRPAQVGG